MFGVEPPPGEWRPEAWPDYPAPIIRRAGDTDVPEPRATEPAFHQHAVHERQVTFDVQISPVLVGMENPQIRCEVAARMSYAAIDSTQNGRGAHNGFPVGASPFRRANVPANVP